MQAAASPRGGVGGTLLAPPAQLLELELGRVNVSIAFTNFTCPLARQGRWQVQPGCGRQGRGGGGGGAALSQSLPVSSFRQSHLPLVARRCKGAASMRGCGGGGEAEGEGAGFQTQAINPSRAASTSHLRYYFTPASQPLSPATLRPCCDASDGGGALGSVGWARQLLAGGFRPGNRLGGVQRLSER